jgi:hypothetical protein
MSPHIWSRLLMLVWRKDQPAPQRIYLGFLSLKLTSWCRPTSLGFSHILGKNRRIAAALDGNQPLYVRIEISVDKEGMRR